MIYFPQLKSGATAQFPLERTMLLRTADCELADGTVLRAADPGSRSVRWKLTYRGLTDIEWSKLEGCFQAARGRLNSICFLDPFDNLLSWSADPTQAAWTVAAALSITAGTEDVTGGNTGLLLTNHGATTQRLYQRLDVPADFQYCWSAYIRRCGGLKMMAECSDGGVWMDVGMTENWTRISLPCSIPGGAESVTFGIDLPAGATAEICGMQVEAQPNASRMRTTRGRSGIYAHSRFDQDSLTITSAGPNDHATTITIISQLSL